MTNEPVKWLVIRYRNLAGTCFSVGIAVYVPATDELFMRFREDLAFVDASDLALIAESNLTIRNIAIEMGGRNTFNWMSDCLSNTLFVEGPKSLRTDDPKTALDNLYRQYCADV